MSRLANDDGVKVRTSMSRSGNTEMMQEQQPERITQIGRMVGRIYTSILVVVSAERKNEIFVSIVVHKLLHVENLQLLLTHRPIINCQVKNLNQ